MRSSTRGVLVAILAAIPLALGCKSTSGAESSASPNTTGAPSPRTLPFTRLHNSSHSGFASPSEIVIQDSDELTRRWRGIRQGTPDAPLPSVDFKQTTVILVATGSRNTDGHSIRVDSVTTEPRGVVVHYTVTSPGARCMSLQVLTAPVEVIGLERVSGVARFRRQRVSGPC